MSDIRVKVRVQVGPDIVEVERVIGNPNRYSSKPPERDLISRHAVDLFERALPLALGPEIPTEGES